MEWKTTRSAFHICRFSPHFGCKLPLVIRNPRFRKDDSGDGTFNHYTVYFCKNHSRFPQKQHGRETKRCNGGNQQPHNETTKKNPVVFNPNVSVMVRPSPLAMKDRERSNKRIAKLGVLFDIRRLLPYLRFFWWASNRTRRNDVWRFFPKRTNDIGTKERKWIFMVKQSDAGRGIPTRRIPHRGQVLRERRCVWTSGTSGRRRHPWRQA